MSGHVVARATAGGGALVLVFILAGVAPVELPAADDPEPVLRDGKELFGQAKVWSVHLNIAAAEYDAMQPAPGGFGPPPKKDDKKDAKKDDKKRDSEKNQFGTDFP